VDQRSIVLYLAKKSLSATALHRDLEETLGPQAVAYSTVTMYLPTLSFRGKTEEEEIGNHGQPLDEVDEAILKALADEPFSSVRGLARHTCLSRTAVHRHLTCSIGSTACHLRWVPHRLSPGQKVKRMALSRELLSMLHQEEARDWHNIITLDESWFCLCTDHELIWLTPGEMVPEREWCMIQSPKSIITVAWNERGATFSQVC
jgi:hypothetical protein